MFSEAPPGLDYKCVLDRRAPTLSFHLRCFLAPVSLQLGLRIGMIQTRIILLTFLTNLSSGIPVKSPILILTDAKLRRTQHFNRAIRWQFRRTTVAGGEICEVEESEILLTGDIVVTARVCKAPGVHPLLGEGYTCAQDHLNLSLPRINALVPSGCSLMVMDSLRAEPSPLALDDLRFQGLELPSGVQIVADHRICESLGENNGSHRLGGREYSCHQQHLTIKSGALPTLLPAGCVCYHQSPL